MRQVSGAPVRVTTPLTFRQHDWPWSQTGPLAQETCDSVLSADGYAGFEYESFPPWQPPYTAQGGNGGDVSVVTTDGWAKLVATMDGGHPGQLYYFVGPGVGQPENGQVGGWVAAGPNVKVKAWSSVVAMLQQSFGTPYAPIGALSPAYTRYIIDTITAQFLTNGGSQKDVSVETLISEHYTGADPTKSPDLERFFYARGWGKVRWEFWSKDPPTADLPLRAPNIAYGYPDNPPLNPSLHLVDVRNYTNLVPQPGPLYVPSAHARLGGPQRMIADFGWPPNFVLP